VARLLSWDPLVSLGTISYGVYLFHLPIACLMLNLSWRLQWPGAVVVLSTPIARYVAASIAVITLTWLVAEIHYQRIERWVLRIRPPGSGRRRAAWRR
jgi:peptidoglycan/LPS O-acetylase OafA/YrhL